MVREVGIFLKNKRHENELTQEELAHSLGISSKFVSKWERGLCLPPLDLLRKLCSLLKIPKQHMIKTLMDLEKKKLARCLKN